MIKSREQLWDMSADGNDKSNQMNRVVGNIVAGIVLVLMKIVFRFSVKNRDIILQFTGKKTGAGRALPAQFLHRRGHDVLGFMA